MNYTAHHNRRRAGQNYTRDLKNINLKVKEVEDNRSNKDSSVNPCTKIGINKVKNNYISIPCEHTLANKSKMVTV